MARTTVVIDAANDPRLARDLTAGGAFVMGYDLTISEECDLVVHNGGVTMRLAARVVWINPVAATHGVGLEVVGFGAALRDQLSRVIEGTPIAPLHLDDDPGIERDLAPPPVDLAFGSESGLELAAARRRVKAASVMRGPSGSNPDLAADDLGLALGSVNISGSPSAPRAIEKEDSQRLARVRLRKTTPSGMDALSKSGEHKKTPSGLNLTDPLPPDDDDDDDLAVSNEWDQSERRRVPASSAPPATAIAAPSRESSVSIVADLDDAHDEPPRTPAQETVHARIRGLNLAEQIKLAHSGALDERVVLERLYGKNVWEPLLRNPRLTAPEVSRIARMGALPRVLLEIIVGNGAWLQIPDVRRSLLTNPRLGTDQIVKILRLMPKPELRLVPTQMQLPMTVREHAKKLLRGDL